MARFLCLVMPLQEMYNQPAPSRKSLTIHYERRPPHFLLIKSLYNGHYLLASLITSLLLANILTVSVGGILSFSFKFEWLSRSADISDRYLHRLSFPMPYKKMQSQVVENIQLESFYLCQTDWYWAEELACKAGDIDNGPKCPLIAIAIRI